MGPGDTPMIKSLSLQSLRSLRWVVALSAFLLFGVMVAAPAARTSLLKAAGWSLVADDRLVPADIVVVTADSGGAGVLEAADLVRSGIAPRVAVFEDPPDAVDREFLRRGLPYEDAAARAIRQLHSLGVEAVERIPRATAGTEDVGWALEAWCRGQTLQSIVVVVLPDHSRRVGRVLRRTMGDQPTRVIVRSSHYSSFDPDRWWQSRSGIRTQVIEWEKLILDLARHPLS